MERLIHSNSRARMIDAPPRVTQRRMYPASSESRRVPFATDSDSLIKNVPESRQLFESVRSQRELVQINKLRSTSFTNGYTPHPSNTSNVLPVEKTSMETQTDRINTRKLTLCTVANTSVQPSHSLTSTSMVLVPVTQPAQIKPKRTHVPGASLYKQSSMTNTIRSINDRPPFYPPGRQPWPEIVSYLSPNRPLSFRAKSSDRLRMKKNTLSISNPHIDLRQNQFSQPRPIILRSHTSVNLTSMKSNMKEGISVTPKQARFHSNHTMTLKGSSLKSRSISCLNQLQSCTDGKRRSIVSKPFWSTLHLDSASETIPANVGQTASTPLSDWSVSESSGVSSKQAYQSNTKSIVKGIRSSSLNVSHFNQPTNPSPKFDFSRHKWNINALKADLEQLQARATILDNMHIDGLDQPDTSSKHTHKHSRHLSNATIILAPKTASSTPPAQNNKTTLVSLFQYDRPLTIEIAPNSDGTHLGSMARVGVMGCGQALRLMNARIVYDLTYRPIDRVPWWWHTWDGELDSRKSRVDMSGMCGAIKLRYRDYKSNENTA